jgi:hypothetical protein
MQPSMPTTSLFETQPNQNLWLLKAALIKPMYRTPQLHKNSADMSVNPHACHEFTSSPLIVGIAWRGRARHLQRRERLPRKLPGGNLKTFCPQERFTSPSPL